MNTQKIAVEIEMPDVQETIERFSAILEQQFGFIFPEMSEEDRRVVLSHYGKELRAAVRSAALARSALTAVRAVGETLGLNWSDLDVGESLKSVALVIDEEVEPVLSERDPSDASFKRASTIADSYGKELGSLWWSALLKVLGEAQNTILPGMNSLEEVDA